MKNKFIALALVTLSIATTTVSCNKDHLDPTDVKSQNVETANVEFSVNAENTATAKVVDRNAAPLFVNDLTIWATSQYGAEYNTLQSFTFGTEAGLPTGFSLPNVALGQNTFGAHSTPANSDQRLFLGNVILPSSGANVLDVMKAHTPYIKTYATNVSAVIKKTGNEPVALTMKTDYGRILAKFVQSAPDADNYIATVQPTVMAWDDALGYVVPKTMTETVITPTTGFEWSDESAMFIYKASFKLRVYEKLANGTKGALLNTIDKEVQIAKSTTKLCTFTIKNSDVETNIENGGIVLTFPQIGEEVIND